VKAAPEDQILLLDVQRLDNELTRIAHRIAGLQKGDALAAGSARAASLRSELASATGDVEDAERELARLESDIATAEARVERDTTMLQATSNPKAAAGYETELSNLARRISELEDAELEVMERVEIARARVGDVEARLAETDGRQQQLLAERDAQVASLTTDRERTEADRRSIAARVPSDLLDLYERQRARYGFGASLLQGGVSTASGVALTSSDLARIRVAAPDDVLLCPDSDAILVRTGESGL
jgi:predicted  nucleic acid-binding Zn-ribbon protein